MDKAKFTPLKRIPTANGDVLHGLKCSDDDFSQFGEAYFSFIEPNKTKGWKMHKEMDMNLLVPIGDIQFHLYNDRNEYETFRINKDNYGRLMVPAGYWMAFEGKSENVSLLLNIASIEHDPKEARTKNLEELEIR
ncbi:WxcM-like domain-containing protein [Vibrio fluvialis]|uniref:WxcM-like domain-containing protein n=1 Tax=Vibrio fluvialis TaxID=676 RepID=UPI00192C7D3E|nr:WxcM-like domain-containing protein [Vibrio fluvialis]MBL4284426.1 WxcM-like domain-containing protein [Vibrio fluvialis]